MTLNELGDIVIGMRADLSHVKERVDEMRQGQKEQWEKIDEHSVALGVITDRCDAHKKDATKNGFFGGVSSSIIIIAIREFIRKLMSI